MKGRNKKMKTKTANLETIRQARATLENARKDGLISQVDFDAHETKLKEKAATVAQEIANSSVEEEAA